MEIKRKNIVLAVGCLAIFIIGLVGGYKVHIEQENATMGDYDLYFCIYNNAKLNDFTQDEYQMTKIYPRKDWKGQWCNIRPNKVKEE